MTASLSLSTGGLALIVTVVGCAPRNLPPTAVRPPERIEFTADVALDVPRAQRVSVRLVERQGRWILDSAVIENGIASFYPYRTAGITVALISQQEEIVRSVGILDPLNDRVYYHAGLAQDIPSAARNLLLHEDPAYDAGPVIVQLADVPGACRVHLTVRTRAGVIAPPQTIPIRTDAGRRRC